MRRQVDGADQRTRLAAAAGRRGASLAALSRLIGRNANYLQQWMTRGTPRVLAETDRRLLSDFLGIDEAALGGPERGWQVPRLDVSASAGPGALVGDDVELGAALGASLVPPALARALGLREGAAAVIRVAGDSMAPGLTDGDELLVDEASRTPDAKGGVYVVRVGGTLLVKRVRAGARGLIVTSDNPAAPPVGQGTIEVAGRAVWQMRRPV